MTAPGLSPEEAIGISFRRARFEDVAAVLRLVAGAVERGCAAAYDARQRRAVFLSYAESLCVDVLGPFDSVVAERAPGAGLLGYGQVDLAANRLRALFVAPAAQGSGIGLALLGAMERRALRQGVPRLYGAMSLNAVPFYARAGFRPASGPRRLLLAGMAVPVAPMEKWLGGAPAR